MEEQIIQRFHDAYIKADSKELDALWENSAPKSVVKFFPAKYTEQGVNYFCEGISKKTLWLWSLQTEYKGTLCENFTLNRFSKQKSRAYPFLESSGFVFFDGGL